ncbi:MAG: glycerol-3-phosphate dehydrogenase [Gammaproteobacteria bacterium]
MENTDIFVIGGGINGAAIAADAAGRGLSVILCEKDDLASGTSSRSTKLIHGGLRYLETYEFNLVKTALREREILMRKAPHLVTPLEFVLPHEKHLRPAWMIRVGLFIYDHLAKRTRIPSSKYINLKNDPRGAALLSKFSKGFSYFDCWTDDARLTVLNALAAKENNATILTRHEFISVKKDKQHWEISIQNTLTKEIVFYRAKVLINAAGPWINQVQKQINPKKLFNIELVKGSHIIVPKIFEGRFAYILQNTDERVVFAIPYHSEFTLVGTTDVSISNEIDQVNISSDEKDYLCTIINKYFKKSISVSDIVASYSGVRCLQNESENNPAKITRDQKLLLETEDGLPILTVVSGKITTHRSLAEEAIDRLKPYFPNMKPAWTASTPLPGGNFIDNDFNIFYGEFKQKFSWLPEKIAYRYAKSYGTKVYELLGNAIALEDLGEKFSDDLYQKEVEYLIQCEWAKTADDLLWRRSKLGLFLSDVEQKKLAKWLESC